MVVVYVLILLLSLIVVNYWVLWILMEFTSLFFFLIVLRIESKSVGLVIYYFFHSFLSLILFVRLLYGERRVVFLVLLGKLGIFPFFYWLVVVVLKVGLWGRIMVLVWQKISSFWMFWLVREVRVGMIVLVVYISLVFVFLSLLMVVDLWLLIIYSSIRNSSLILISLYGDNYMNVVIFYLGVLFLVLFFFKFVGLKEWCLILVLILIVIPPFGLFYMKFIIFLSLDFFLILVFLLGVLDFLVLLYYFSLLFFRFMVIEVGFWVYFINLLIIIVITMFRRYVTLIYINES